MLDQLFFDIFQHYKTKHKAKANNIALLYILLLQASLLLFAGIFLMLFLNQMQVDGISGSKAWSLYILLILFLLFRNWIYYTGKKRKVLNTKLTKNKPSFQNIWLLWLIPTSIFTLSLILLQRL